jgi:hypothetical protein
MAKILAIIFLILFIWVAIPHIKRNEWLGPTAVKPGWWGLNYDTSGLGTASATLPDGYGWFRYDYWNNPPLEGRPVTRDDFRLRY